MILCIKSYIIAYVKTQKNIRFVIHYVKPAAQLLFKIRYSTTRYCVPVNENHTRAVSLKDGKLCGHSSVYYPHSSNWGWGLQFNIRWWTRYVKWVSYPS